MAVIKFLLVATGTAAIGLIVGSKPPTMKPAPEPYWSNMTPYSASDQGAENYVAEASLYDLRPIRGFRHSDYASGDNLGYADALPVYVPAGDVELTDMAESDPVIVENVATDTDQAAEAARQTAAEVNEQLQSEAQPI